MVILWADGRGFDSRRWLECRRVGIPVVSAIAPGIAPTHASMRSPPNLNSPKPDFANNVIASVFHVPDAMRCMVLKI